MLVRDQPITFQAVLSHSRVLVLSFVRPQAPGLVSQSLRGNQPLPPRTLNFAALVAQRFCGCCLLSSLPLREIVLAALSPAKHALLPSIPVPVV